MSFSNFDDKYDDDFEGASSRRKKSEVPDDDYECQIELVELRDTKAGDVLSFKMIVLKKGNGDDTEYAGKKVEKAIFLNPTGEDAEENRKKRVEDMKRDFATLGFDVDNWTKANGRPFGKMCEIACRMATNMKVKVRLKTNNDYQNCYLNKRLEDGKPPKVGAAEMAAAKPPEEKAPFDIGPPAGAQAKKDDPIPF